MSKYKIQSGSSWYADFETFARKEMINCSWWYEPKPTENDIVDGILEKYKRQDKNPFVGTTNPWKPKWKR